MTLPKLHYIAMSGNNGCLPDHCNAFRNRSDAIQSLIDIFEFRPYGNKATELKTFGYVTLEKYTYGAEYASVEKCDCNNMKIHNDDGDE